MKTCLPLTGRIIGDMRSAEPWAELTKILETTWLDKDGNGYRPVIAAMDVQGDFYPEALAFIKSERRHRLGQKHVRHDVSVH